MFSIKSSIEFRSFHVFPMVFPRAFPIDVSHPHEKKLQGGASKRLAPNTSPSCRSLAFRASRWASRWASR